MLKRLITLAVSAAFVGSATADHSHFPGVPGSDPWATRPNDPDYEKFWQLFSHVPVDHRGMMSEEERRMGSGMHVDRAWQMHTGQPSMLIAVLDSGINWDSTDLIERHYLNIRELPLPEGSHVYDRNADGRVSVSDWQDDSRVSDANGNGVLDAWDLIRIFSDGIDDDANGYTDDIAGWDFHEHDNDPDDRTRFGHGTGEAKDSAAAINNGHGGAGICGNCTFVALRLNDSFIVDSNAFAQAVIYATDMGAGLIQQALGGVNHSVLTKQAVNYAYDRNVVVIGSAADENSYHHNYPSTLDPVVYTNAIRFDTRDFRDATTFLNFNNCSNYGARVDVATSGRSCSSEATGNLSGISALARSYAQTLGRDLTAGELISMIKNTATDINLGPAAADSGRHTTREGWDTITGYGRTNAHDLLTAIKNRMIPPEARILTPEWFDYNKYEESGTVSVSAKADGATDVTIAVMRGVETALARPESGRITRSVRRGAETREQISVSFSHAELAALPLHPEEEIRNHDAYTLILTARNAQGLTAEARRTFFLHRDERLLAAFPRKLAGSGESSGLFADMNSDGRDEFVTADGSGFLHAFTADGSELPGFPVTTPLSFYQGKGTTAHYAGVYAPVAAGDLDGDGGTDIVAATLEGHVIAYSADGSVRNGFPVLTDAPAWQAVDKTQPLARGIMAAPVLADLTGDGRPEIIAAAMDGKIYVYDANGRPLPGFPVAVVAEGKHARLMSSPAVYDADRDGTPDLILGSNHTGEATGYLFAVSGKGTLAPQSMLAGFPVRVPLIKDAVLPTVGTGIPTAPAIADFTGDGVPEILVHAFVGKPYLIAMNGSVQQSLSIKVSERHETNDDFMLSAFGHPAPLDVNGDGVLQPVTVGVGQRMLVALLLGGRRHDYFHMVGAWDTTTGSLMPGYPKAHDDMILAGAPIGIDINNDGRAETAVGSGGYFLRIKGETAGSLPVSETYFTGGWIFGAPATGDMDGDGLLEIAVTTREGYAFIWKTAARKSDQPGWNTFKGNNQRTGVLAAGAR